MHGRHHQQLGIVPAVQPAAQRRARKAAVAAAVALGLATDDAVVLNDSNRLVLHLMPCNVVARIVPLGYRVFAAAMGAEREVQVVRRLADADAPVAALESRVEPRVFVRDGFEIELLTYYQPIPTRALPPEDYADALERLHSAMRQIDVDAPHFTDRVADVQQWVARRDATPDLTDEDRDFLVQTLRSVRQSVVSRAAPEQLLHGEPHPWNVLDTTTGPRFVDFENCVRGPVEWDLGWVPTAVGERYSNADRDLVVGCRGLVLAIVAAHAWRPEDERPGTESAVAFLKALREGPPWTALDAV
jgi:aminoglycoside phosphotransferase (APT) family kinase protein